MKLDKAMLDGIEAEILGLDKRLVDSAGTVSARKAEARAELLASEEAMLASIDTDPEGEPFDQPEVFPLHYLELVNAELEALKVRQEEAKQAVEDAVIAALKAKKADVGAELSTLKTERASLVETAEAMATLLKVKDLAIPRAPKGTGGTSTGTRAAKSSTGAHYVKAEDGTCSSYKNDSYSGLAFYAFKRAGVEALTAALQAAGVTELTKPWEATVTVNGITRTIGLRITPAEVTPEVTPA